MGNVCHVAESVVKTVINDDGIYIDKKVDQKIVRINQAKTLDRDFASPETSTNILLNQSTSILNKCDIYNHTVSTTAKINEAMLKNISSTSRPRDTANSDQQNNINSSVICTFTWLGSISTANGHNEVQKKYGGKIECTINTSMQEYSSLYTWLAGESDKEYSDNESVYTDSVSALQSISRASNSLQDMYMENHSLTVTNPHNTTMYTTVDTTINTVYI